MSDTNSKYDELRKQIIELRKSEAAALNEAWRNWEEDGEELSDVERFVKEIEEYHISKLQALIVQQCNAAQTGLIDYIMRKPTGELTMTVEEMKATSDAGWRDEVIQYFFNADSLMFNLQRKKEELQKTTKEVE